MVHIGPRSVMVALAGLGLVGLLASTQPGGSPAASAQTPAQASAQAGITSVIRKQPPDRTQRCPTQYASWTLSGGSLDLQLQARPWTNVAVSLQASTTRQKEAFSTRGGPLSFLFSVAAANLQTIHVRTNETGCAAQQVALP